MIEIDTDRSIGAAEAIARDVLYRETEALDRQEWNNWLDCYCEDARFWVPTWIAEHKLADDPDHQVSMIYHVGRRELEERVFRITSLKSVDRNAAPQDAAYAVQHSRFRQSPAGHLRQLYWPNRSI